MWKIPWPKRLLPHTSAGPCPALPLYGSRFHGQRGGREFRLSVIVLKSGYTRKGTGYQKVTLLNSFAVGILRGNLFASITISRQSRNHPRNSCFRLRGESSSSGFRHDESFALRKPRAFSYPGFLGFPLRFTTQPTFTFFSTTLSARVCPKGLEPSPGVVPKPEAVAGPYLFTAAGHLPFD